MTVNLFYVTKAFAVFVADRRLSYGPGKVASERAKKLLRVSCPDASLIVAFNGYAGKDADNTPLNWLEREDGLANLRLDDLLERTKKVLETGVHGQPKDVARLSVTFAGYWMKRPVLFHISNYEHLGVETRAQEFAADEMHVDYRLDDFIFEQTGFYPPNRRRGLYRRFRELQKSNAKARNVEKELLKAVRDIPFKQDRAGVVGPNCDCETLNPDGSSMGRQKMIGKSQYYEFPSIVAQDSRFTQIMVGGAGGVEPPWGFPKNTKNVRIKERNCVNPKCKGRVPDGHERCATCGEQQYLV